MRIPLSYNSTAVAAGRADNYRPALRYRRFGTFLPALLVAGLATGVSPAALATPPANHVWGGCILTPDAVAGLEDSLGAEGGVPYPQVDFVLVYTLQNDNDGQSTTGGYTGPILCTNPDTVDIETTNENTPIPNAGTVDITALEQALIMQYDKLGVRQKRICHTVADNTDCFLITPVPSD